MQNWLTNLRPPGELLASVPSGDANLWWGVIREAARDVGKAHESLALDGLEFLRDTGVWLCEFLWGVEPTVTRKALVALVRTNPNLRGRLNDAISQST